MRTTIFITALVVSGIFHPGSPFGELGTALLIFFLLLLDVIELGSRERSTPSTKALNAQTKSD
jgi:hypothetical protein